MQENYEKKYLELEKSYWLLVGCRELFLKTFYRENIKKSAKIVEIGCSTGVLLEMLRKHGWKHVRGVEMSDMAISALKKKKIKTSKVISEKVPVKNEQFDVVIASNVLEHIKKDRMAIKEWSRILKPGGKLILLVPAFQALWSYHDELNLHYRRYRKKELRHKLNSCFKIKKITYWNASIFLPLLGYRRIKEIFRRENQEGQDELFHLPKFINTTLREIINLETFMVTKGVQFPFGVSLYAVAEKKGK